ncbi:helix-turn-helix domain-containing protein [Candidatus Neomarinimicrobiota bacterium]
METFIKKYRDKRVQQKISLEDLNKRTKISVKHLEAIEKGQFNILPNAYVRLFFKAYVSEIGSDPDKALSELDRHFVDNKDKTDNKKDKPEQSSTKPKQLIKKSVSFSKNTLSSRSNLINGLILLLIWIFAIIIIRKITISNNQENIVEQSRENRQFVNEEILQSNYQEISKTERILDINPPYVVTIVATDHAYLSVQTDSQNEQQIFMTNDDQRTISFLNFLDIIIDVGINTELFLNEDQLQINATQTYPVRILFTTNPLQITISQFIPLN